MKFNKAIKKMYKGHIIKFMGSKNCPADFNTEFCMKRGVVFLHNDGEFIQSSMIYDPKFRYELTDKKTNCKEWPCSTEMT